VRAYKHFARFIQAFIGLLFCWPLFANSEETLKQTNARLALASNTNLQPSEISVDIAPFAHVVSWDPNRVEQFRTNNSSLEKNLPRQADGSYLVPSYKKRLACIGLQWPNRRTLKELHLEFMYPGQIPQPHNIQVEGWFEESASRSAWKLLEGTFKRTGNGITFYLAPQNGWHPTLNIQKARWIFSNYPTRARLREISAFTDSKWDTMNITVEAEKPLTKSKGTIQVFNGQFVSLSNTNWNFRHPIHLQVCYSRPSELNSDPTVLQFKFPTDYFEVPIEDLQTNQYVYLPTHGLFIARESAGVDLATYKKKIANGNSLLKRGGGAR
jgi:hypothetical protein